MIAGNTRDDGTPCGATGCLFNRPADRSDDFTNVTSKLGLTYEVTSDHTLYVTGARGYRAPDTSELYRLQRQQSVADLDSGAARQHRSGRARRCSARCAIRSRPSR